MIKLIASDIDGTLLNHKHELSEENIAAIEKARKNGIHFLISTGRKYKDAVAALKRDDLADGYVILSGAQTRNAQGKLLNKVPLSFQNIRQVVSCTDKYPVLVAFNAEELDYIIGDESKLDDILCEHMKVFWVDKTDDEIVNSPVFRRLKEQTRCVSSLEELEEQNIVLYKIFIFGKEQSVLDQLDEEMQQIKEIASASSFACNLEITQCHAQKGLAIQEYIEHMGIQMEEVMVIGDSMNDMSMLSMDYGATVAMDNANEVLKKVSKYITTNCDEHGVAKAINSVLERSLDTLKNPNYQLQK